MNDTVEIVYRWPDGKEEIRHIRPIPTTDATKLMNEVDELKARLDMLGEECPYFYRFR